MVGCMGRGMAQKTVETGDVTVTVDREELSGDGWIHGQTTDSAGDGFVWRYNGEEIEWIEEPHEYARRKTEIVLEDVDCSMAQRSQP